MARPCSVSSAGIGRGGVPLSRCSSQGSVGMLPHLPLRTVTQPSVRGGRRHSERPKRYLYCKVDATLKIPNHRKARENAERLLRFVKLSLPLLVSLNSVKHPQYHVPTCGVQGFCVPMRRPQVVAAGDEPAPRRHLDLSGGRRSVLTSIFGELFFAPSPLNDHFADHLHCNI